MRCRIAGTVAKRYPDDLNLIEQGYVIYNFFIRVGGGTIVIQKTSLTQEDQDVFDLVTKASSQYARYVELNTVADLSELLDTKSAETHDWNTPLDVVWAKE
jgi:hypothetical protein